MKRIVFTACIFILLLGCAVTKTVEPAYEFKSVAVDTILHSKIEIRAIAVDKETVWYAGDKGRFGYYNVTNGQKYENSVADGDSTEFRSIALAGDNIFILNVGNPAKLYRLSKSNPIPKLVYTENHEKVFYDSMQFWNDKEGIAVGDPINDCFSILVTANGGETWHKLECSNLPRIVVGEAAFAASNTNTVIKDNKTWIVSGGKKSRIFYSADRSKSWQVYETPVVQGLDITGSYTADFYNANIGFIAGGNYESPQQNFGNKALTTDGGKHWKLVSENQGFGYASCVQFVPDGYGKELVSVGFSGLFYSEDMAQTWTKLLDTKDFYTIRFIDRETAVAAGHNCLVLLHFK